MSDISVIPKSGGRLLCDLSADAIGLENYAQKQDFRRYLDREIRAEGYNRFRPNPTLSEIEQCRPVGNTDPITLIAEARLASGRLAVVVGTPTKLFRFFGMENGGVYEAAVFDAGVFEDTMAAWVEIGSGYKSGDRWEAEMVGNFLVLNNGVDLPLTYRVDEMEAKPIYELREQGIASVGTIAEHNDILICCDIRQIDADEHRLLMAPISSAVDCGQTGSVKANALGTVNSGVAGVEGNTLTADAPVFLPEMTGTQIRMANGMTRTVTYVSATQVTLDGSPDLAEPAQPFWFLADGDNVLSVPAGVLFPSVAESELPGRRIFWADGTVRTIVSADSGVIVVDSDFGVDTGPCVLESAIAYAAYTTSAKIERYQWRQMWSMPSLPRRWGAIYPGTVKAGERTLKLDYPVRSIEMGQSIIVLGAGAGGGNLTSVVVWSFPGISNQVVFEDEFMPDIQDALVAALQAEADATAAQAGAVVTLDLATQAYDAALKASNAAPDDSDLKAALADTSSKLDTARQAKLDADTKLAEAVKTREAAAERVSQIATTATAADAEQSITGLFDDLEGNGGAILKAKSLRGVLVIYKDSNEIFLARYTGITTEPFRYERLDNLPPASAMRYRHTLISVNGQYHIYAGHSQFWQFDLTNRMPTEFQPFTSCQRFWYDSSDSLKKLESSQSAAGSMFFDVVVGQKYEWIGNSDTSPLYYGNGELICVGRGRFIARYNFVRARLSDNGSLYDVIDSQLFGAHNPITNEVMMCSPSGALLFDYRFGTVSTTPEAYSAAGAAYRPESTTSLRKIQWMLLGLNNGLLMRYGMEPVPVIKSGTITAVKSADTITANSSLFEPDHVGRSVLFADGTAWAIVEYVSATSVKVLGSAAAVARQTFSIIPAIYHRDGQGYASVLASGLSHLGKSRNEKLWNEYTLILSSQSPAARVTVDFRSGRNPGEEEVTQSTTIPDAKRENMVQPTILANYIGDRITVSGMNNPVEIVERLFSVEGIGTKNVLRRNTNGG